MSLGKLAVWLPPPVSGHLILPTIPRGSLTQTKCALDHLTISKCRVQTALRSRVWLSNICRHLCRQHWNHSAAKRCAVRSRVNLFRVSALPVRVLMVVAASYLLVWSVSVTSARTLLISKHVGCRLRSNRPKVSLILSSRHGRQRDALTSKRHLEFKVSVRSRDYRRLSLTSSMGLRHSGSVSSLASLVLHKVSRLSLRLARWVRRFPISVRHALRQTKLGSGCRPRQQRSSRRSTSSVWIWRIKTSCVR